MCSGGEEIVSVMRPGGLSVACADSACFGQHTQSWLGRPY